MDAPIIVDLTDGGTLPDGTEVGKNKLAGTKRKSDITGIVFHHTGGSRLIDGMLPGGKQSKTGAQFYIDADGTIYRRAPDTDRMTHIRSSGSQYRTDKKLATTILKNDNTIGVEIVAPNSDSFTQAQRDAAASLAEWLSSEYDTIQPAMIVGHGEIQGGAGGNKMPTEGVTVAQFVRNDLGGLIPPENIPDVASELSLVETVSPHPYPAFRSNEALSAIEQLTAIRADREERLSWGQFTRDMEVPLPAPKPLSAPIPDIAPTIENEQGGMVFAPTVADLTRVMQERYGTTYQTGSETDLSIYRRVGLPSPTMPEPVSEAETRAEQRMVPPVGPPQDTKTSRLRTDQANSADTLDDLRRSVYEGIAPPPDDVPPPADGIVVTVSEETRDPDFTRAPDEAETRDEQRQMRERAESPIGKPPVKRPVKTIEIRREAITRDVGDGIAPHPDIGTPAPGVTVSDTGTARRGRPVLVVGEEFQLERAGPPAPVSRVTPVRLPSSILYGNLLTQSDLKWTPPKTLREALAGTSYARASDLDATGFAIDNDPYVAPPRDIPTMAETRKEQRVKPPSLSIVNAPRPDGVMAPADYNKLVEKGTEKSPEDPAMALPRNASLNENWIDRGKRQGRLVPSLLPYPIEPKKAPTPAPSPRFRRVVETVENPKYAEWKQKYGSAPVVAPTMAETRDEQRIMRETAAARGKPPVAPIVPPAPNRTITTERMVAIAPQPHSRPAGGATTGNYVIQKGDSLSAIAARYGTTVGALQKANGIKDANRIYAGKALVIPNKSIPAGANVKKNGSPTPTPTSTTKAKPLYVNRKGEALTPQTVTVFNPDSNTWESRTVYRPAA